MDMARGSLERRCLLKVGGRQEEALSPASSLLPIWRCRLPDNTAFPTRVRARNFPPRSGKDSLLVARRPRLMADVVDTCWHRCMCVEVSNVR